MEGFQSRGTRFELNDTFLFYSIFSPLKRLEDERKYENEYLLCIYYISGTDLKSLHKSSHSFSRQPSTPDTSPCFTIEKIKLRQVKSLIQDHTVEKWQI